MNIYAAMQELLSVLDSCIDDTPKMSNKYAIKYSKLKKKGKTQRSILDRYCLDIDEIARRIILKKNQLSSYWLRCAQCNQMASVGCYYRSDWVEL